MISIVNIPDSQHASDEYRHLTPAPLISTVRRLKAWKLRFRDRVAVLSVCDTVSRKGSSGPVTSTLGASC